MLVDVRVSHYIMDLRSIKILGLFIQISKSILIMIVNYPSDNLLHQKVYIMANMRRIKENSIPITEWYILYDLKSFYDLIESKN
jgi:hypothetical protein